MCGFFFPLTFENVGIVITIASTLAPLLARHTHWSTQVIVYLIVVCTHIYIYVYVNIYVYIYLYGICPSVCATHALEHPGDCESNHCVHTYIYIYIYTFVNTYMCMYIFIRHWLRCSCGSRTAAPR